jgi:hypothetical protein
MTCTRSELSLANIPFAGEGWRLPKGETRRSEVQTILLPVEPLAKHEALSGERRLIHASSVSTGRIGLPCAAAAGVAEEGCGEGALVAPVPLLVVAGGDAGAGATDDEGADGALTSDGSREHPKRAIRPHIPSAPSAISFLMCASPLSCPPDLMICSVA